MSAAFNFEPHFCEVLGSAMHYIDEGSGDPILLLHGNPTWSYLWRNIIPHLREKGRVIAPDLIGMGRSAKPDIEYRFVDHARYLETLIETLGLRNVTLVIHDWGSVLGFHYAMRHEANVKGIAFMEANILPRYRWDEFDEQTRESFRQLRTPGVGWDLAVNQNVFIEQMLPGATRRRLSQEEMDNYRAPFLDPASRKPLWRWANELPIAGDPPDVFAIVEEYNRALQRSNLPKLLLYVTPGAVITAPAVEWCRRHLTNLQTVCLGEGIHFVQEDYPDEIGSAVAEWYDQLG